MLNMLFYQGKVWLIGGCGEEKLNDPNCEHISKKISCYCPETKEWTGKYKSLPAALCATASGFVNDYLYIVGGLTPVGFSDCIYKVDLKEKKSVQALISRFTKDQSDSKGVIQIISPALAVTKDSKYLIVFGGSTYTEETDAIWAVPVDIFAEIEQEITKNIVL